MAQMAPNLDDLRFQKDLVDEARRRITRYCPEWTDYNLSDPGITLIELFAYMTEMMVYRLNRVPEKNYLKFLEMMGMTPQPASSARAELTFYLSVPFPLGQDEDLKAVIPLGLEVTTRPSEEEPEVTFSVDEKMVLAAPRIVQLRREADFNKNYLSRLGIEAFYAFNPVRPRDGDTFYIGFDESQDIRGYILRLTFDCEESQAVGVRRDDPPWVWECSLGDNRWEEIPLSARRNEKDTTGGLNNPHGALVVHLPFTIHPDVVHGRSAFWLRCRLQARRPDQGMYAEAPRIRNIEAHTLGGKTWATHASLVVEEALGISSGEAGQTFRLQHAPVLAPRQGEEIQVEERRGSEIAYIPWTRVTDFSNSDPFDRHYSLDESSGEICFGPDVRQPDGSIHQYGRVPEAGRRIRCSQYRYGGGVNGNVPAERIQVMRSAVPYIDRVSNFNRAEGGRDLENLDEVKLRSRRELRAQQRAVTAEDYENLARASTREVARVKCTGASRAGMGGRGIQPGAIDLLVVPAAFDAVRQGELSALCLPAALQTNIRAYLDQYRLLATILNIREPSYIGVRARVEIVINEYSQPEVVRSRVNERLQKYLSPLDLREPGELPDEWMGSHWEGWPFGRNLVVSELYSLVQQVPGVKHVLDIHISSRSLIPSKTNPASDSGSPEDELVPLPQRMLVVPPDTLLVSLGHEIVAVDL
jgi:predicted phage baseplate assembly protein